MGNTKILCVDDDEKVLNGILRQQGDDFDISIAVGPHEALEIFDQEGPFAIVLSDMRMPGMNGAELLAEIRERSPDTVRMVLTGFAELSTTIEAINQGNIFRFLGKPCSEDDLAAAFQAGLRQYALIEAEKELVEGTLHGSVKVLSEVLSLVNPLAFGQSSRVRATVGGMLKRLEIADPWQLEIAAMLSSLGCVTLPAELLEKRLCGESLTLEEEKLFDGHPGIASQLIRSIPRLDRVAEIISHQNVGARAGNGPIKPIPIESQILALAFEFDLLELNSESSLHALSELKAKPKQYDATVLDALTDYVKSERNLEFAELMIQDIREGMVLAEDITNANGALLMAKGQEITSSALHLLENISNGNAITQPIKMVVAHPPCVSAT